MNHYAFTYTSEAPRGLPQVVAADRLEYLANAETPLVRLLVSGDGGRSLEQSTFEVPTAMLRTLTEHAKPNEAFRSLEVPPDKRQRWPRPPRRRGFRWSQTDGYSPVS